MSIEAVHWALDVPVSGNAKVILIGIANHAKPDGSGSFPSLDTLAEYAFCDRATVRRNLGKLEADGWLQRTGIGPRGQTSWSLIYSRKGGGEMPSVEGVAKCHRGVASGVASGVAPMQPEPTTNKVGEESPTTPLDEPADLVEIFEYWRQRCRKPKAKFTVERKRRVRARLAEKYTVLDIRQGIDGAAINPPVDRDSGMVYDDLVSICRNGAQLERYMTRATIRPAAATVTTIRKPNADDLIRKLRESEEL